MRSAEPNPGPTLARPQVPSGRITIQISRGGLAVLDLLLAKWRPAVDQQAWDTLMSLDSHAVDILQELDLKTDTVNNPSAYIQRAVSNAVRGQSGQSHGRDPNPGVVTQVTPGAHYMVAPGIVLDEKATVALQATAPEIAAQVIAELQTKDPREVRNPSAYVQRALSNAKLKVAVPPQEIQSAKNVGSDVSARLDDDARHALQDVSPEAAQHILQLLAEAGEKVHNPSAYVMKAVRNHQEGDRVRNDLSERGVGFVGLDRGDGGSAEGAVDGADLDEELRLVTLDEKAQTALKSLPASSAVQILRNLKKQARQVSNCSAWVVKAVGNATARPPAAPASAYKRQRV